MSNVSTAAIDDQLAAHARGHLAMALQAIPDRLRIPKGR